MSEARRKRSRATNPRSARGAAVARGGEVPQTFDDVVALIRDTRQRALQTVNSGLIDLYWRIGEMISRRIADDGWGQSTVAELAAYIQRSNPGMRGFSPQNLWRMRQFFEAYRDQPELSTLLRELPWSANLHILSKAKRAEEREFYVKLATKNRWPVREVARQIDGALFERAALSRPKLSTALRELHPQADREFKDAYLLEFLDLPDAHSEDDLHRGLLQHLGRFLTELGRGFCYVGSEFPLQVGGKDFALDLLFFNRTLNCLVAIELKIDDFKPEYLGKLEFYLEALDRNVRKPHEGPRAPAVRDEGQRGCRIRVEPGYVADAGGRIPHTASGSGPAAGQTARVLPAGDRGEPRSGAGDEGLRTGAIGSEKSASGEGSSQVCRREAEAKMIANLEPYQR